MLVLPVHLEAATGHELLGLGGVMSNNPEQWNGAPGANRSELWMPRISPAGLSISKTVNSHCCIAARAPAPSSRQRGGDQADQAPSRETALPADKLSGMAGSSSSGGVSTSVPAA